MGQSVCNIAEYKVKNASFRAVVDAMSYRESPLKVN